MYLRHLSTEYRSILSADMSADISTDTRPICRPRLGRHIDRHQSTRMSADTRPIFHRHSAATRPPLIRYLSDTSCITYVFEMAAVWATSSLYQQKSIGDRRNLLVRWRLLFQQNISINTPIPPIVDRYITDSRPIHQRLSIATYRPKCRPSVDRHIDR